MIVLWAATVLMGVSLVATPAAALLPPEGEAARQRHAELLEAAHRHEPQLRRQVNIQADYVTAVVFARPGAIDVRSEVDLPPDLLRHWGEWRSMQVHGDTAGLSFFWRDPDGQIKPIEVEWRSETTAGLKAKSLLFGEDNAQGHTFIIEGVGRVDDVRVVPPTPGIAPEFDDSPWATLGADKPTLPVIVRVDPTQRRSIAGIDTFEREKYLNVYANIFGGPDEPLDFVAEHGFEPGRQMFKFHEHLELGEESSDRLREDPLRPGHADLSFFDEAYDDPKYVAQAERWSETRYAMCMDNWPSFMWADVPFEKGARGTPAVEHFDAAAELAAAWLHRHAETYGRTPTWLEVKNESDISHEWGFHALPEVDSWKLLGEFHNVVADAIHERYPDVAVAGPTAAWPAFANGDWRVARNHLRFLDLTKGHLDAYSYHFYDPKKLMIEDRYRNLGDHTYLLGEMQNVLDLVRSHQHNTDNVKPLIITEYGSLHSDASAAGQFMPLRNYSAYMTQLMNRPDMVDLAVPFILPMRWWDKFNPASIFVFESDDSDETFITDQQYFLDLWQDYAGDLVAVASDTDDVNVHAVRDGRTIQVVVSNLRSRRATVDLRLPGIEIESATQKRLYLEAGELVFDEVEVEDISSVPVAVEETTIVRIETADVLDFERSVVEEHSFSTIQLARTGVPAVGTIPAAIADRGVLRVGLHRSGGFDQPLQVEFNGRPFEVSLDDSRGIGQYNDFV
ncbi:MAG: hypothetical protein AAF561_08465, partial [Planctomycetota bacterium]